MNMRDYDEWWEKVGQNDPHTVWWVSSFRERETRIRESFGETDPPRAVTAFTWADPRIRVSGGCALTFPPSPESRSYWVTVGEGLTQPARQVTPNSSASLEFGFEFAVGAPGRFRWCTDLIWLLMTYVKESGRRVEPGDRVPICFVHEGTELAPRIGKVDKLGVVPYGNVRGLIFWPCLICPRTFETSSGNFGILMATAVTEDEIAIAKSYSSAHLLLLLCRAGISQVTVPDRPSILENARWHAEFDGIRELSQLEAEQALEVEFGQRRREDQRGRG